MSCAQHPQYEYFCYECRSNEVTEGEFDEMLAQASGGSQQQRLLLASGRRTPDEVLHVLRQDPDEGVRRKADGQWRDRGLASFDDLPDTPVGPVEPVADVLADSWALATTEYLPGFEILETRGFVSATCSTMLLSKIVNKQEERLAHAADTAAARLLAVARQRGANAVIAVRMTANNAEGSGMARVNSTGVLATGTAVVVRTRQSR